MTELRKPQLWTMKTRLGSLVPRTAAMWNQLATGQGNHSMAQETEYRRENWTCTKEKQRCLLGNQTNQIFQSEPEKTLMKSYLPITSKEMSHSEV